MKSRRSIIHLTTFLQGGAGRAITELACAQHRSGDSVLVIASRTGEGGYQSYPHYLEQLHDAGVPVLLEDSTFKRDIDLNQRVLERLVAVRRPATTDLVHAHAGVPARIAQRYAALASRPIVVVQTQHGWGINKTREQARDDLATLRSVDRVIVTSEASRQWLIEQGVWSSQIVSIPCGLSETTAEMPDEGRALRATLLADHRAIVGCVGSVTVNKNQQLLLHALTHAANRDLAAVFVGEGGEALHELSTALGVSSRVRLLGYRPSADGWMRAFDLVVAPSLTEGQGLVALEAFRAGVPVVASDIPAFRQFVSEHETGWLFASGDAEALAHAIDRSLVVSLHDRTRITTAARVQFLTHYTVDAMVARHDALYAAELAKYVEVGFLQAR